MFRKAVPDDKEAILNIRKNLYDGLDFMPEFFPQLVSPINGTSFIVHHEDKAVSMMVGYLSHIYEQRRLKQGYLRFYPGIEYKNLS